MQLSKGMLSTIANVPGLVAPDEKLLALPEKVLQFGTGVLLRGLPDYFIDKANKQGVFNGRVVVVKSTSKGGTDAFEKQDGLYTLCIKGIEDSRIIEETVINASVSRVLSAAEQWADILQCAHNPEMKLVVSNTTEVGIVLSDDDINLAPPASFPGKLLAFLYERYKAFSGSDGSGLVIVPTELITNNGDTLRSIVLELAVRNKLDESFMNWLQTANHFCNSLVDRIVPGKLPAADSKAVEEKLGYTDELMIMAEPFRLWVIQSGDEKVKEVLAFAQADEGVVITPDIEKFRELKLRLLNGTHTFSCGLAALAGFETVKEAMNDETVLAFVQRLMMLEIATAMDGALISYNEACAFASKVLDRFRNPFLEHKWLSITMNYTSKMRMRNIPLLQQYHAKTGRTPEQMAAGFAAYLLFMKCSKGEDNRYYGEANGQPYLVEDEAAGYFAAQWALRDEDALVDAVLTDKTLWGTDLSEIDGLAAAIKENIKRIQSDGALAAMTGRHLRETIA
ncbi:MAG: tagaturonate reductase [Chitinophagaceae bacterium]